MSLQSNRQISFSDINKNLYVSNGNMSIGTTSPAHTLDINGGVRSTNFTTTNALITNISSGAVNATNSTITNIVVTNISSGTLNLSSLNLSTGLTTGTILATTSISSGGVNATNSTITNSVATNSTVTNVIATNISSGTLNLSSLNLSTGLTTGTILATTSISSGGVNATNSTITNAVRTNISSGTLNLSTGLTTGTILSTTSLLATGNSNTVGSIFTTGGNVGIGTVPGSTLDVKGNSSWGLTRLAPTTSGGETAIGFFALNDFTASGQATSGNWLLGTGINIGGASNFNLLRNTTNILTVVTNGNVGIGTTSPSFPLDVNGTIRNRSSINGANGASIENPNSGSSAYSILTLATDGVGNFNIFKNSTTRTSDGGANTTTIRNDGGPLRLQSNTGMGIWVGSTGNVGINTTSPSTMLELNDSGNSGVDFLKMYQPNLATGGSTRILLGKSDDLYGRANITFKNANNNYTNHLGMGVFPYDSALIINSQGWVGMGTTNPSVKLEVIGNTLIKGGVLKVHDGSDAYGGFEVKGTNGSYIDFGPPGFNYRSRIIHLESEFSLNFIVNSGIYNTFAMTLASTGNVGLGTTTPIAKLHVNGSAVIDGSAVINGGSLAVKNGPSGWTGFELQGSNASYIDFGPDTIDFRSRIVHQESDRSLTFTVNGSTTAIQIASTGRVTIGGSNGSYPLTVFGSSNSGSIGGYAGWYNVYGWQNQTTSYDVSIYSQNFIMAGQGFVSVSDQRIKKDIIEIEDGESLSILRQIEPKRYRYIDEYKRGTDYVYGFIAQQVRGVLPAASGLVKDFIPSIMTLATVSYDSTNDITTVTLVDNKQHNLTSENSNSRVRFFDENDMNTELELHEIVSDDIFKVKGELKGVNTFVYGVEVDDFHTLNKDAIFTVAVSALQQVDKELQETKQKVSNLETELTTLQQQYQDMLARIINLELK